MRLPHLVHLQEGQPQASQKPGLKQRTGWADAQPLQLVRAAHAPPSLPAAAFAALTRNSGVQGIDQAAAVSAGRMHAPTSSISLETQPRRGFSDFERELEGRNLEV
jgi:hypothetical protein